MSQTRIANLESTIEDLEGRLDLISNVDEDVSELQGEVANLADGLDTLRKELVGAYVILDGWLRRIEGELNELRAMLRLPLASTQAPQPTGGTTHRRNHATTTEPR